MSWESKKRREKERTEGRNWKEVKTERNEGRESLNEIITTAAYDPAVLLCRRQYWGSRMLISGPACFILERCVLLTWTPLLPPVAPPGAAVPTFKIRPVITKVPGRQTAIRFNLLKISSSCISFLNILFFLLQPPTVFLQRSFFLKDKTKPVCGVSDLSCAPPPTSHRSSAPWVELQL
jgi:hypothetical protein